MKKIELTVCFESNESVPDIMSAIEEMLCVYVVPKVAGNESDIATIQITEISELAMDTFNSNQGRFKRFES